MVIPGVTDRKQCAHPKSHYVINWRLCEAIEYTTSLADHGVTYEDYCLLLDALASFRKALPPPTKAAGKKPQSSEQAGKDAMHAAILNKLLSEITKNWRTRGVPVMVVVASYSLFAPRRITEAHVEILHVPFNRPAFENSSELLSFIDPFVLESSHSQTQPILEQNSVTTQARRYSEPSVRPHPARGPHRDYSRPIPLWPNAIPTPKRQLIESHIGRYGADPYFREYMRANVDSRATSASYAKFMIEKEDNPFINTRLEYIQPPKKRTVLKGVCIHGYKRWKQLNANHVNRLRYEHNRRLECRKAVELGSKLRILRFSFRHPIFPRHTPEMTELGLDKDKYDAIIKRIQEIRQLDNGLEQAAECRVRFKSLGTRGVTEHHLTKASEYIRQLNNQSTKIIWTIEKIPCVYDAFLRGGSEWEVSAWNSEDHMDLLLQLEKWGIIEKRLDIEEEDN
jgi:hypothetical protein